MDHTPKWAQPIFSANPHCSICEKKHVFFETLDKWTHTEETSLGEIYVTSYAMKRYCTECFYEYGGQTLKDESGDI